MTGQPPPVAPANRRDGKGALGSSDFTAVRRVNDFEALVWHDVGIHEDTCAHSHLPQVLSNFRGAGVEPKLIFIPNELHFEEIGSRKRKGEPHTPGSPSSQCKRRGRVAQVALRGSPIKPRVHKVSLRIRHRDKA